MEVPVCCGGVGRGAYNRVFKDLLSNCHRSNLVCNIIFKSDSKSAERLTAIGSSD